MSRLHSSRSIALVLAALVVGVTLCGCAAILSELEELQTGESASQATPADGLREALRVGTTRAVGRLGVEDGYLGNELVRIPVPSKLETVEKALRAVGADHVVDDFVANMNRAAETAAPLAKSVFLDTIREMTFDDAVAILRGRDHEATDYLRANAGPRLAELFRPIVARQLDSVGATRRFDEVMDRASALPLVRRPVFELDQYVTDRALAGLFETIAREEKRIRDDPLARTTELLRRFFGQGA